MLPHMQRQQEDERIIALIVVPHESKVELFGSAHRQPPLLISRLSQIPTSRLH
jgi:hypothetical protein